MRCYYCNLETKGEVCTACSREQKKERTNSIWSRRCVKQVVERQDGGLNTMELAFQRLGYAVRP
jgi:hypothetical protein